MITRTFGTSPGARASHSIASRLLAIVALAMVLAITIAPSTALAHTGDQSYLYLDVTDEVTLELQLPFQDIEDHLGIVIEGSDDEIEAAILANEAALVSYAREHIAIGANGRTWDLTDPTAGRFVEQGYAFINFTVGVDPEDVPDELQITLDPFFDENPDRDALFLIANDWQRGYIEDNADPVARFTPGERVQSLDIGDRGWTRNLSSSFGLGLDHIKTGPDHILFVAVLLLPSVLVFRNGWRPVDSFSKSLWRVLKIVSMFTVAHSITFTLAGLELIPLPGPRFVETIIAVSIAAAALLNIYPIWPQREWLIAFAFGLFHGLGFASLIGDLEISRSTRLVSLIGRNLGIEVGQVVVVLVAFPALFMLRRTKYYLPFMRLVSAVLVVVSLGWVTERLFDAPAIATRAVDLFIEWPRVIWIMAAVTVAAAAVYKTEDNADRLLEIDEPVTQ